MVYEYILIKNGFQGKGTTQLTEMGKVEAESAMDAVRTVQNEYASIVDSGENIVFVRPDVVTPSGTLLS